MTKLQDNKKINFFVGLCCVVYFTSYLTRKNYDAALVEIYTAMAISPKLAGLASTGAVITYGAGQLLSGVLGDYLKPKNIIFTGLIVTCLCNFALPLCGSIYPMIGVWCINGLAQAMMWPPMVKIMSVMLEPDRYKKGVLSVTIASSTATILIYLCLPLFIKVASWKASFIFAASVAAVVAVLWKVGIKKAERFTGTDSTVQHAKEKKKNQSDKTSNTTPMSTVIFATGLIPIAIAIVLQGTLRDGVNAWMPTILKNVYELDTSKSILSTVILPLLAIFSATAASGIQRKIKNEVGSAALLFVIATISTSLLFLFYNKGVIVSVVLMGIITACMHGINLMLVCEVPNYFSRYNKVSTVSGVLNSFTYLGAAVAIYCIPAIAEKLGDWTVNFRLWAVISLLGTLFCVIVLRKWKTFRDETE